jgi:hypothetical protein
VAEAIEPAITAVNLDTNLSNVPRRKSPAASEANVTTAANEVIRYVLPLNPYSKTPELTASPETVSNPGSQATSGEIATTAMKSDTR